MEERIKTAEDEKEALKQKIAKLELAAGQGTPTSNGNTEVSHGAITLQIFNKFLWNLQPDSMSCKVPPPPTLKMATPPTRDIVNHAFNYLLIIIIIIIIIIVKNALDLSVKAFSRKVLSSGDTILHLQLYVV